MTQIAFFKSLNSKGVNLSLQEVLDAIKAGKWEKQINQLRALEKGSEEHSLLKKALPSFMVSASTKGGHKASDIETHSGLLQIDIDDVGTVQDAINSRDRLGEDRHLAATWLSPSGTGIKAIMLIPASIAGHKMAFEVAAEYLHEKYAVRIDSSCKDVSRLCFVSYDPAMVTNPDAVVLEIPKEEESLTTSPAVALPPPCPSSYSSTSTSTSTSTYNLEDSIFKAYPESRVIYNQCVLKRSGKPCSGARNDIMVEITSFLAHAVSPDIAEGFAYQYFADHYDVFADYGFGKYQREVRCVLNACLSSYPQILTQLERQKYEALTTDNQRATFRIARSLSQCNSDETVPSPFFFLSYCQLGKRIGVTDQGAVSILKTFQSSGIIEMVKKGKQRSNGIHGIATTYRWLLSADHDARVTARPNLVTPMMTTCY